MIGLPFVYTVAGLMFALFAWASLRDRRPGNAAFHALIAVSLLAGDVLGDTGNGVLVLALVGVATLGRMGPSAPATTSPADRAAEAAARRDRLFLPMLVVPVTAVLGTLAVQYAPDHLPVRVDPRQATLVALAFGVLLALGIALAWLRDRWTVPVDEGRRLMDGIGWAAVLPQMLASLGAVFALGGVGEAVGGIAGRAIPDGSLFGAVLVYALGMALFTMAMGNAFAAFPVMATAIGVPLLVKLHGGDPAGVAALGMLAGFCGTLMTPMAANFNIVPAALLELRDRNAVVRAQVPTALPMLAVNVILLYLLAFP